MMRLARLCTSRSLLARASSVLSSRKRVKSTLIYQPRTRIRTDAVESRPAMRYLVVKIFDLIIQRGNVRVRPLG